MICFRHLHCPKGLDSENRDRRAELVLLHTVASPFCRDGERASRRFQGLTAKFSASFGEQCEKSSQDPVAAWLGILSQSGREDQPDRPDFSV